MTSLSILLSVLYTKLLKHKDELAMDSMTDLNNDIVTEDTWTVEKIKNRTDKLVIIALDLFKL